jgi:hypothetical protein
LEDLAEIPGTFIPIQIDLDYRTFKIRDSFVWNIHGEPSLLFLLPRKTGPID